MLQVADIYGQMYAFAYKSEQEKQALIACLWAIPIVKSIAF